MGLPTSSEWADFMPDTVTIAARTGHDGSGKPTYGSPTSYQCRIQMKNHLVVDGLGRVVTARGSIFMLTTTVPGMTDLLTLPAEYTPTTPPMISVNPVNDENGTHHVTLEIG